ETRRQVLEAPAAVVIANHAMGLYELAAIHLSAERPQLDEAKLAIDALAARLDAVESALGPDGPRLRDALAPRRRAYAPGRGGPPRGPRSSWPPGRCGPAPGRRATSRQPRRRPTSRSCTRLVSVRAAERTELTRDPRSATDVPEAGPPRSVRPVAGRRPPTGR